MAVVLRAARGALLMWAARVGLNVGGVALRKLLRRRPRSRRIASSSGETVVEVNEVRTEARPATLTAWLTKMALSNGALRWALFGALLKLALQTRRDGGGAVGGALAGAAFIVLPSDYRRSLAIFAAIRALDTAASIVLPSKLGQRRFSYTGRLPTFGGHSDTIIMVISSAIVCNSLGFYPGAVDPSYLRFLRAQMGVSPEQYDAFIAMVDGKTFDLDKVNAHREAVGVPKLTSNSLHLQSDFGRASKFFNRVVYDDGCYSVMEQLRWLWGFYRAAMWRAAPIYAPILALQLARLFQRRAARGVAAKLRRRRGGPQVAADLAALPPLRPLHVAVLRPLRGFLRSSFFLSSYCCWGVLMIGVYNALVGKHTRSVGLVSGGFGGLAVLIEAKARRMDLALFVGSKALDIALRLVEESAKQRSWRWLQAMVQPDVIAVPSMALLAHALSHDRALLRRGPLLSLFERFIEV